MVTNYPQQLANAAALTASAAASLPARLLTRVGQATSCGHDTPGWEISGRGPRPRYEGDPRRHLLTKPRLVLRKSA